MTEKQEQLMEERLRRFELAIEELDRVGSKLANAAETMAEAANRSVEAVDRFEEQVQNLEGTLTKDRQRRRTGG